MKIITTLAFVMMSTIASAITAEQTIAATLWHEARGEGCEGIKAVASVIVNRADNSGKSLVHECLRPKQFSCWNGRKPSVPDNAKGKVWNYCLKIARQMCNDTFVPTIDATHYYNPSLCSPSWGRKMHDVTFIGQHKFGRV